MDNRLVIRRLRILRDAAAASGAPTDEQWGEAREVLEAHAWEDAALKTALEARDATEIARRMEQWEGGHQPLPPPDRATLKRALKAFRKRLKLQQLDDESRIGGGPFSGGRRSSVVAIQPPAGYPDEVWQELAIQGRLRDEGQGFYELAED